MITVIVEHYLNEEGKTVFSSWVNELKKILKPYKGYVSLDQLIDVEDESRTLLELKFENMELLRYWSKSKEHDQAIAQLLEYRIKKQKSQIFKYKK